VTANQVKFVGPLNGQGHALTVVGSADFEGAISGLSNLSLSGLASLNAGTVVSTGALVYAGPVTLAGDTTITTPSVTFRDTVDGAHALVVTGAATFGGAVGGITPLASLSVGSAAGPDAVIRLNGGGITTAGGQTYSAPVMLGADTTLSSTTAGNIRFTAAATIDGPHALAVNTAGVSTFAAPVGEGAPLASFTTDPAGRTVLGDSVTTTGSTTTSSRSSSRCSPS